MMKETLLGDLLSKLEAIKQEHGPDVPVHIDGMWGEGVTAKVSDKGWYRENANKPPAIKVIIDIDNG
jgi:hypothetical protein